MRIDGALTPPGFIASAKMHTLVIDGGKLYILFTGPGPASRADWSKALNGRRLEKGTLENLAVGALMKGYMKTIAAAEERISSGNLDELTKEKNSHCLPTGEVTDVSVKVTPVDIRLTFKGAGKKHKFDCGLEDKLLVDELAALLTSRDDA